MTSFCYATKLSNEEDDNTNMVQGLESLSLKIALLKSGPIKCFL